MESKFVHSVEQLVASIDSARNASISSEALKQELVLNKEELRKVHAERDATAKEKGEALKAVEELKQQVSAQGAELEKERKEKRSRRLRS